MSSDAYPEVQGGGRRDTVQHIAPLPSLPAVPDAGRETGAGLPHPGGGVSWRAAGIALSSLGTPMGIGVTDPLLGHVTFAAEPAVALTVAVTVICAAVAGACPARAGSPLTGARRDRRPFQKWYFLTVLFDSCGL